MNQMKGNEGIEILGNRVSTNEKNALIKVGISTIEKLASVLPCQLLNITPTMTHTRINQLKALAFSHMPSSFDLASRIFIKQEKPRFITTGIQSLDELLGGGIERASITEIYGESGAGKSFLCHQIATTAQIPEAPGLPYFQVIFIDTEKKFRPENITRMAPHYGIAAESVLDNIICSRPDVESSEMLMMTIMNAERQFLKQHENNLTNWFRFDYAGANMMEFRQISINNMMMNLKRIAARYNIGVLIKNQVKSNMGASNQPGAPDTLPIGGNVLAHAVTTRLSISKTPTGSSHLVFHLDQYN